MKCTSITTKIFALSVLLALNILSIPQASAATICSNEPIPANHGIVQVTVSNQCSATNILYQVEPLFSGMAICSAGGVPDGYVVTRSQLASGTCRSFLQYLISTPIEGITMCAVAPPPDGYIVDGIVINPSYCYGGGVKGYSIRTPRNGSSMCSVTRVPDGFVANYVESNVTNCANSYRYYLYAVDGTREYITSCGVDGLGTSPDTYVVSQVYSATQCKIFPTQQLHKLNGTAISMCALPSVSIPDGYELRDNLGYTGACSFGGTNYQVYRIVPTVDTSPVTADFSFSVKRSLIGIIPQYVYYISADATTSFPEGSALTYTWTLNTDQTNVVQGSSSVTYMTFSSPPITLTLTVTDGTRTTDPIVKTVMSSKYSK